MAFRFSEEEFVAFERVNGTKKFRGMREACRLCGCSLVGCYCDAPEIVATDGTRNVAVFIERK